MIVIDGDWLLRSSWAIKTHHHGQKTGGVVGFVQTIQKMWNLDRELAVAWDDGPLVRQQWYPPYKKDRVLLGYDEVDRRNVKTLVRALGIDQYSAKGWEADDVLYTLWRRHRWLPFGRDKDLLQIPRGVWVGQDGWVEWDRYWVQDRMGVYPEQVADLLAIVGDPVDGIRGLQGVGIKTASAWLRGELRGKRVEKIKRWVDGVGFAINKKLVQLYEVEVGWVVGKEDLDQVKEVLEWYGIKKVPERKKRWW